MSCSCVVLFIVILSVIIAESSEVVCKYGYIDLSCVQREKKQKRKLI